MVITSVKVKVKISVRLRFCFATAKVPERSVFISYYTEL